MYDPRDTSGASRPLWANDAQHEDLEGELDRMLDGARDDDADKVDVIVVGAGITGLSVAYHLIQAGRSVRVIDQGRVARGETARSTAHASNALDDRYHVLERLHGADGAKLAAESHALAIESIERIARDEGIACGFARVDGYLFAGDPADAAQQAELEQELEAARRAGLAVDAVDPNTAAAAARLAFRAGTVLRFRDQAQLDPLRYTYGLARAVRARGGRFVLGARVVKLDDDAPIAVHVADGRRFEADFAVFATNTPVIDRLAMHTKQAAYRTYALALAIAKGSVERALYWDTASPYHYVRVAGDDDVLIVGGEDHKVGQASAPEQAWVRLEAWTRTHFPEASRVLSRWSGQVWEPVDKLAFIGRNPGSSERVLIATGDSGNGITHGALAGIMLSDRILGRASRFAELYEPARKMTQARAARELLRENLNVAVAYGGHVASAIDQRTEPHELEPGEGMIVRRGLRRIALYRDETGVEHACLAVCTHLGGPLHWNAAERSWDCPCHGARFDPRGRVLTGPAFEDLTRLDSSDAPLTGAPVRADDALPITPISAPTDAAE